jgi:hypothetical protein
VSGSLPSVINYIIRDPFQYSQLAIISS